MKIVYKIVRYLLDILGKFIGNLWDLGALIA